jgi:hypothetical protein
MGDFSYTSAGYSIPYSAIPVFVKKGSLFKERLDVYEMPLFKETDQISDIEDLLLYFKVIGYCRLAPRYIAQHIYEYVFTHRQTIIQNYELVEHIKKYPEIHFLTKLNCDLDNGHLEKIEMDVCVRNDYLNVLKVLHNAMYPWDAHTCDIAAIYGSLCCLKYLFKSYQECKLWSIHKTFPWENTLYYAAVEYGNLNILIYAHQHGCPLQLRDVDILVEMATKADRPEILSYLREYM